MHIVAIAESKGELDSTKLAALAADIGTTAYELRLLLNMGLPAVVLVTADGAKANAAAAAIARQRQVPVICDRSQIQPSAAMTALRDFELGPNQLVVDRASRLACGYDELRLMVRAVHRSSHQSVEQVKERQLRPVMAVATGGLIMSKKVTKEVTTTTSTREHVLYLFRSGQEHPWILRERVANYSTLGSAMGPASFENFTTTVARLRQFAPRAVYDERLINSRPIRGLGDGSDVVDIWAYLMAAAMP
jgi:hypothetical protein